jgi:hypothetical protein
MFAKLPLFLLTIVAMAGFGICETTVNSTSYNDLVDLFPECSRSCFHDLYDNLLQEYCGDDAQSSTDLRDAACVCRKGEADDIVKYDQDVLIPCLQDGCPTASPDTAYDDYMAPIKQLFDWCEPAVEKYGSDISKLWPAENISLFGYIEGICH